MNPRQSSVASKPLLTPQSIPTMAYAQSTYANHPVSVAPPGPAYPMGATAGPLTAGPGAPVAAGRAVQMPMTVNGQPQGPGGPIPLRYAHPMGMARPLPNGMVPASIGRGMGMPSAPGGVPSGMRMTYSAGMSLPGTRPMNTPGTMVAHPPNYSMVHPNGHTITFAPISQQQHVNPNGSGQPPAHMVISQQQPGGPPPQPHPLAGQAMAHPGPTGHKLYQQPATFIGPAPVGVLPPPNGGSPVRNQSPNAMTPARAPTPGGPGVSRGIANPPTPVNTATPFASANAPTPGSARPGTASGQSNPQGYIHQTPRVTPADAIMGSGLHNSPGTMQRHSSANLGMQSQPQQQQGQQPPPQQQLPPPPQRAPLAQPGGGPGPQPSGGGGLMDHSYPFRLTPTEMEIQRNLQIFGPEGVRYSGMGMGMASTPGQVSQPMQPQPPRPGQVAMPAQNMAPGQPLQPQLTGGGGGGGGGLMTGQSGGLPTQHMGGGGGGARALAPQHTGGSIQDSVMNPPGGGVAPPTPAGRASMPATPQIAHQTAGMNVNGGGGSELSPLGTQPLRTVSFPPHSMQMQQQQGFPMVASGMAPPPPRVDGFRTSSMELDDVSESTMGAGPSRHAFGVLRLLKFSSEMRNLSGHGDEKWQSLILEHFTETATLKFRASKDNRLATNTFVTLPFQLLVRFFATLTRSNVNRMSLILDGAMESQEGQEYTVYCPTARWQMYYDNGYILELNGVLKARCKTVPGPSFLSGAPNGVGFSPSNNSSSNSNAQVSPTNKLSNPGGPAVPNGPETKFAGPTAANQMMPMHMPMRTPYLVKIAELSFDSQSVSRLIDSTSLSGPLPSEPDNDYGIPRMTLRVIEFAEGSQALGHIMESTEPLGQSPLDFLTDYMKKMESMERHGDVPAGGSPSVALAMGPRTGEMMMTGGSSGAAVAPATIAEPAVSPSLVATNKAAGNKNVVPGSPTKAGSNSAGGGEKDKGGGKRKNTNDADGPAAKRRTTRKGSKVT